MLEILKPGISTSIQDLGRFGFRNYGVPQSGVLDKRSYYDAVELISGQPGQPVIETFMAGLKIRFYTETFVGVSGAAVETLLNGKVTRAYRTIRIKEGDELQIKKFEKGWISYIAVAGMQINPSMGSYSTTKSIGLGGFNGRMLKTGDQILLDKMIPELELRSSERKPSTNKIHITKGPEFDHLDYESKQNLFLDGFVVLPQSDRMGLRLNGPKLKASSYDIESKPVYPGTIQLTPHGPIILLSDCQTTGGYPRIGHVNSVDMDNCGQSFPGRKILFVEN